MLVMHQGLFFCQKEAMEHKKKLSPTIQTPILCVPGHQFLSCTVTLKNAFVIFSDNSVSTQIHHTYIFLFWNI